MRAFPTAAIALLALLASAPAAAADARALTTIVAYDAPASQDGELSMFFLLQPSPQTGLPWFELAAARVEAVEWVREYEEAAAAGFSVPVLESQPRGEPTTLDDVRLALQSYQAHFEVHVFSPTATVPYQLESAGGQIESDKARMGLGKHGPAAEGHALEGGRATGPDFSLVEREDDQVVHTSSAPRVGLHVTGDFVVEMRGLTLEDADDPGTVLESGTWTTPVAGAPPGAAAANHVRSVFLRLTVTGGSLDLGTEAGAPRTYWAASQVSSVHTGPVTLKDAVWANDQVQHTRYVVPANSVLDIQPQDGQLAVGVSEARVAPVDTASIVAAPASAALVGTGAVLALLAAIGVGVLRRTLRLPALADVERAIEEGEYRRAARLAGRILGRLPGSEEALLGRAIALSKDGRPAVVVDELTRHLSERPASDGTLHYVLGLAQLEVGRVEEGQRSLREAVRRTPSLQPQVAPRLGKAFSPLHPTPKETHGYA
jgi:hypothetical protein